MSNAIAISSKIPTALRTQNIGDLSGDLVDGASGSFGILSIRGSKFRIKSGGEEEVITNAEGDPVSALEVVLVKANAPLSKIFYMKAYEEGDDNEPDCFSMRGDKPDAQSKAPQSKSCAACKHNVWGSAITPAGKKTKACSDSRRIAIVPASDIANEAYGGPILLRVPGASLGPLADYGKKMASKGIPYNALVTKIAFDPDASYPRLVFKAIRVLADDEAGTVAAHLQGDTVQRILELPETAVAAAGDVVATPADPVVEEGSSQPEPIGGLLDEMDEEEAPVPAAAPKASAATKKKAAAKKAAAKPAPVEADDDGDETDDAEIMSLLDAL